METVCKNCETSFEGNFCPNCGQRADIERLTFKGLINDIGRGLFSLDKGLFPTISHLITKPGVIIKSYIEGKRKKYLSPYTLLIITSMIYGVVYGCYHLFNYDFVAKEANNYIKTENPTFVIDLLNHFIESLYSSATFSQLLLVPFFALAFYNIFHKKCNYNYVESFYIFTFISSISLLFSTIVLMFFFWYPDHQWIESLLLFTYIFYFIYRLIPQKIWKSILQTILMLILSLVYISFVLILLIAFVAIYVQIAEV